MPRQLLLFHLCLEGGPLLNVVQLEEFSLLLHILRYLQLVILAEPDVA